MSDFRYCVGTVARATVTGDQVVTGIADADGTFSGKAILIWSTMQSAEGFEATGTYSFGFSDGTNQRAISTYKPNNVTGTRGTRSYVTNAACVATCTSAPTVIDNTARVVSFADGTFTLTWDANDGDAWDVHYLVMGGTDLSATVLSVDQPTTPQSQAVTGLGIGQLTGLISLSVCSIDERSLGVATIALDEHPVLGWYDGTNQGCNIAPSSSFDFTPTVTARGQLSNKGILQTKHAETTPTVVGSFTSLDADGFTIDWEVIGNRADLNPGLFVLAIAGPAIEAGTFLQGDPTITTIDPPAAMLMTTVGNVPSALIVPECRWSFGAVGQTISGIWLSDDTAVNTSVAGRNSRTDQWVTSADPNVSPASSVTNAAVTPVLTPTGASLTWGPDDAIVRELLYLAFKGTPAPPTPPSPFPPGPETAIPMRKLRRSTIFSTQKLWNFFDRFQLDFQAGGPRAVNNEQIEICLRYSDDNGNTWSDELWQTVDSLGQYTAICQWFQLGRGRDRVWEVSSSSDVMTVWLAAYIDYSAGTHG